MAPLEQVHRTIERIVNALVDNTEAAKVTLSGLPPHLTFHIQVAPEDIGKIVGKQGRTARSIRTLAVGTRMKLGFRFTVDIQEGNSSWPTTENDDDLTAH